MDAVAHDDDDTALSGATKIRQAVREADGEEGDDELRHGCFLRRAGVLLSYLGSPMKT